VSQKKRYPFYIKTIAFFSETLCSIYDTAVTAISKKCHIFGEIDTVMSASAAVDMYLFENEC